MATTLNLTLRINADGTAAIAGMRQVEEAQGRIGETGKRAGKEASDGLDGATAAGNRFRDILNESRTALLAMAGLHFGRELVADIVEANNKLQGWRYGLEAATGSQAKAAESLAFVRAESDRLGISLEDSATTFTRLAAATKGTALEGAGAQKVFTAVAEAARTLHLSGAETQQTLLALDQMMSKGTVQAQELKLQLGNVLPGAMHIAAEAIGVTTAQFDKMMDRGEILSEDFLPKFAARLHALYGATAAEAANSPAAQLERLKNSVFELKAAVGDAGFMQALADKATGLTTTLIALVHSGAIDVIVRGLITIAQASAVTFAVNQVKEWADRQREAAAATAALAVARQAEAKLALDSARANEAQAAAEANLTKAKADDLRATLAVVEAARAEELAKLKVAQADVVMAERHLAAAKAAGVQSFALRAAAAAEDALTAAHARQASVTTQLATLGRQQATVQQALATATKERTVAEAALTTAVAGSAGAQTKLTEAMKPVGGILTSLASGAARLGSSLLALVGGPFGAAILAATALYERYKYLEEARAKHIAQIQTEVAEVNKAAEALRRYHQELSSNSAGLGQLDEASKSYINAATLLAAKEDELKKKKQELSVAERDLVEMQKAAAAGAPYLGNALADLQRKVETLRGDIKPTEDATQGLSTALAALGVDLRNVTPFVDDLVQRFGELRNAATLGSALGAAKNVVSDFFQTIRAMAADKESRDIFAGLADQAKNARDEWQKLNLGVVGYAKAQQQLALADLEARHATDEQIRARKQESDAQIKDIANTEAAKEAKKHHKDAVKELQQAIEQYNAAQLKSVEFLSRALGAMNPYEAAIAKYRTSMIEAVKVGQDYIEKADKIGKADEARAQVKEMLTAVQKAEYEQLQRTTEALDRQADVVGRIHKEYEDQAALVGLTDRQRAIAEAVQHATDEWNKNTDAHNANKQSLAEVQAAAGDTAARLYDLRDAARANEDASRQMASIWQQSFDTILTTSGNIWTRLKAGFSSLVDSIIQYFARLAVINPILNAIFGAAAGGGSLLPTLANATGIFGGAPALVQTGSAIASAGGFDLNTVGTAASLFGGGGSGGSGLFGGITSLFSASKWLDYGKNLWSGFSTSFGNFWNGANGGLNGWNMLGGGVDPSTGQFLGSAYHADLGYGGYGSALGQGLGIAGGIYAGYNRAQNADGAFGKIGGGLSYGLGTYALGAGLASAAGGAGFAAGVGGAFAIPVVGLVALAAMLIDKFSGGNLFGTGWKSNGETKSNLSFGDGGLSVANSYEEKKKSALFGGNKYRWQDAPVSDEQKDYIAQFNGAMDKVRESAAAALGTSVAGIVTGAFQQRWNKDGKVTEEISTVLGKTYKESMEAFVKRVQAENVLAQINAARGDTEASAIAEKYRKDAEQLSQASQFLLAAEVDIKKGVGLLGEDKSLAHVADLVGQLGQQNETLVQTYQRLQSETQTLRDSLALTGADIGKTGVEFVKFADAAAKAAGGVDQLKALTQTFAQAFYSPDELAKQNIKNLRDQANQSLSALGLDTGISKEAFRKAYEAALPTLTPEQLVQWQQAGVYLAEATAAQKAYNDQLDQATKAQQQATDNYNRIVQQIKDGMAAFDGAGKSDLQNALDTIKKAEQDTIDQLNAAAKAAGMQGAAEKDIALVHEYAAKQTAKAAEDFLRSIGLYGTGTSEFARSIDAIKRAEQDAMTAADALARAQGREGASAYDAARIHMWAAEQIAAATAKLQAQTQDIISQLYGGTPGTLDEINRRIAELQSSTASFGNAARDAGGAINDATKTIQDQVRLMIGDLSPYNDNQKLSIAKEAYLKGNASADDVLNIARRLYASSNDYKQVFDWVLANPQRQVGGGSGGGGGYAGSGSSSGNSKELADLIAQRDKLQAEQAAAQRKSLAQQLVNNIVDLANQAHVDALTMMDIMGAQLPKVVKDLGIDIKHLDDKGVLGLASLADTLHVGLGDLLHRLGIGFGDLETGLLQITTRMGVDLNNLNAANVKKLGDLAAGLHISLNDLLTGLHLDLKDIAPGLRDLAIKQGIDLDHLKQADVDKLKALADTLHISLDDLAKTLGISLGNLGNTIADSVRGVGVDVNAVVAARTSGDREIGVRFDGFARSQGDALDRANQTVTEIRGVRVAVERSAAASENHLPHVRTAVERSANASERHLPDINWNTDHTQRNTSRTAEATEEYAANARSSYQPTLPPRTLRP